MINSDFKKATLGSLKAGTRFSFEENGKTLKGETDGEEEGTGRIKVRWIDKCGSNQPSSLPAEKEVQYNPDDPTGLQPPYIRKI